MQHIAKRERQGILFTFLSLFNFGKFATEVKPTLIVLKNSSSSNSSVRPSILPSYDLQLSRTSSLTWKKKRETQKEVSKGNQDFTPSSGRNERYSIKLAGMQEVISQVRALTLPARQVSSDSRARLLGFASTSVLFYKRWNRVRNINPGLRYLVVRSRFVFGKRGQKALLKKIGKQGF